MKGPLRVSRSDYEAIVAHVLEVYPLEGCGLLAGNAGQVRRRFPITNILASPYRYEMDPQQQLQAFHDLEAGGLELLAIYHSHPYGPDYPSATDVARAYYPEAICVIVSLRDRSRPNVRAFTIVDGQIDEVGLAIV